MKKTRAWGIAGRNLEQTEALKLLLDASVDLVILEGIAGSGKTLLALAAGLEQVIEQRMYTEILFTRSPTSVGDSDMGFLPGTEAEKLAPWCGAVVDNLEVLVGTSKLSQDMIETKVKFKALQFLRGRSFTNKYLIIDEAQNLSVQQLKVLLTRVGDNTKIVVLGDINQVDNRKLTKENNGLAILLRAADNESFIGKVHLPASVRSVVCQWAAEN